KELSLYIEKWVQNGLCLAHDDQGKPIFVHGALPGQNVRADLVKERSTHSFAVVLDALSDCSSFPKCGGCSFRHIPYADEIELKVSLLQEMPDLKPFLDTIQVFP